MDKQKEITEIIQKKVNNYFKDNNIVDLMGYGSDIDEGLYHLTSLYQDIMNNLSIHYEYIYTEDGLSDGKYITIICFDKNNVIKVDTSAWNGEEIINGNMLYIYKSYQKIINDK